MNIDGSRQPWKIASRTYRSGRSISCVGAAYAICLAFSLCQPLKALGQGGEWIASTSDGFRQVHTGSIHSAQWPVVGYISRLWSGSIRGQGWGYLARRTEVDCERGGRRESTSDVVPPVGEFALVGESGKGYVEELVFVCGVAARQRGLPFSPDYGRLFASRPPDVARTRPEVNSQPNPSQQEPKDQQGLLPERRQVASGTGFYVSSDLVVTNKHVVDGCASIAIRLGSDTYPARLLSGSESSDLALLRTNQLSRTVPPLRSSAQLGEEITAAGFPLSGLLSSGITVTSGQISAMAGLLNDPMRLQISTPVQPGSSGGPLFDRFGSVVGVVVAKLNAGAVSGLTGDIPQNVNFAIKPEVLKLFLDANQVSYRSVAPTAGPRLEGPQLAALAQRTVVHVLCKG